MEPPLASSGSRMPPVVAVASGKGGTGKTTVAVNLAVWSARQGLRTVLADCDAENPNAHLFLPCAEEVVTVIETRVAEVAESACNLCGTCRDECRFGAVRILGGHAVVFPELCHGCGTCVLACPAAAIQLGVSRVGESRHGSPDAMRVGEHLELVTGLLDVGEVRTPAVIDAVRASATASGADLVIVDAPPGVACATVAAVRSATLMILVTEPTPFGAHDLAAAIRMGRALGLEMAVVLNRAGSGPVDIREHCREQSLPLLATIPFDRAIAEAYADGVLLLDAPVDAAAWVGPVWDHVETAVGISAMTRSAS